MSIIHTVKRSLQDDNHSDPKSGHRTEPLRGFNSETAAIIKDPEGFDDLDLEPQGFFFDNETNESGGPETGPGSAGGVIVRIDSIENY